MTEGVKTGLLIVFQYGGWALSVIIGVAFYNQRKEIKTLKSNIAILKDHERARNEKDAIRDKILIQISRVIADQNMSNENKKKLDELFAELNKPNENLV
jgi:hypothetical protein